MSPALVPSPLRLSEESRIKKLALLIYRAAEMNKRSHSHDELHSVWLPLTPVPGDENVISLQPAFLLIPSLCLVTTHWVQLEKKKHLTYEQRQLSNPEPTESSPGKNKLQRRKRNTGRCPGKLQREREREERTPARTASRLIRIPQITELV